MFSEKLLTLLATFSKYELNRFRKFLLSPYFNEQEDLIRLFDGCSAAIRKGPDAWRQLDKQEAWRLIYPDRKLDEAQLRRQASDLTQLALKFLALEVQEEDASKELLNLQKALEKPELYKHLAGVERNLERLLNEDSAHSAAFYLTALQMHLNIFNRSSKVVSNNDFMLKLGPADHSLDSFYVLQKLKFYISWLIFRGFRSTEVELPLISGFWEHIKKPQFEGVVLIRIYENIIRSFNHPEEEEHFYTLLATLEENAHDLTKQDLRECYYIAQNYCAFKVNQGKTDYYQIFFGLFKNIIRLGILLERGELSEGVYKNMISISLWVKEFAWAENFIQEYSQYLPSDIRDNARTFNLANLYFHQRKYDQVISLLNNVEYSDIVYSLGSKLILLRTYFEIGEYLTLDSLIDSFRIFLRRNKVISKNLKREYNSFLNFVKKLTTLNTADPKTIATFRQRVMAASATTPKKWLLEKITEIENRKGAAR